MKLNYRDTFRKSAFLRLQLDLKSPAEAFCIFRGHFIDYLKLIGKLLDSPKETNSFELLDHLGRSMSDKMIIEANFFLIPKPKWIQSKIKEGKLQDNEGLIIYSESKTPILKIIPRTTDINTKIFEFIVSSDNYTDLESESSIQMQINNFISQARSHNRLRIDEDMITKESDDRAKLEAEYNFFVAAPKIMSQVLPRQVRRNTDGQNRFISYSCSRVEGFDLSVHWRANSMSKSTWAFILDEIRDLLENLIAVEPDQAKAHQSYRYLLIEKTKDRLTDLKGVYPCLDPSLQLQIQEIFKAFNFKDIFEFGSIAIDYMENAISSYVSTNSFRSGYLHGDLCLSNILFEKPTATITLVDPRGFVKDKCEVIPLEYDLAKLSHSILGGYDKILAGELLHNMDHFKDRSSTHEFVVKKLLSVIDHFQVERSFIWKIESILFLSMIPLHRDKPLEIPQLAKASLAAWHRKT
ncbi:MAG: hypothetical protein ACK5P6_01915 [Pseudobdellovibrionaceae bacterium]